MVPFIRIIGLAVAAPLSLLPAVGTPAHADESSKSAGSALPQASVFTDCQVLRRAISRRACQARLWREEQVDTAENK
jgi:hypothetical protein